MNTSELLVAYCYYPKICQLAKVHIKYGVYQRQVSLQFPATSIGVDFDSPHGNDLMVLALRGAADKWLAETGKFKINYEGPGEFLPILRTVGPLGPTGSYDEAVLAGLRELLV